MKIKCISEWSVFFREAVLALPLAAISLGTQVRADDCTAGGPVAVPYLLNAGGDDYVTTDEGLHYLADDCFSGGLRYTYDPPDGGIANTNNPSLFLSVRYGANYDPAGYDHSDETPDFSYHIPVVPGEYLLQLHFAELGYGGPGQRVFDVIVNGSVVLKNYDIFVDAGGANRAVTRPILVFATSGTIDIGFRSVIPGVNSNVAVIEVLPAPLTRSSISHLVTIIQENHSFDSYFGTYCDGSQCEPAPLVDPTGATPLVLDDARNLFYDPPHDQACELTEINGGAMDAYVSGPCGNPGNFVLPDRGTLRTYWGYANQYALADRYFQSIAGPSFPNDLYLAIGKAMFTTNMAPQGAIGQNCAYSGTLSSVHFTDTTIGDLLVSAHIPFTFYAEAFDRMAREQRVSGGCPTPPPECTVISPTYGPPACVFEPGDDPFEYFDSLRDRPQFLADLGQFYSAVQNGTLPAVTYLKALDYRAEHPGDSSISDGEAFVDSIVSSLQNSGYWGNTLLLVTTDESGGFFDHVPPPGTSPVDGQPYGPRIYLLAVGPFAKQGYVSHVQMEHASVMSFIEWNWLNSQTLGNRDAVANNLLDMLNL